MNALNFSGQSIRDQGFRLLVYSVGMALLLPLDRAALVILPVFLFTLWPKAQEASLFERLLAVFNIALAPLHILFMRYSNYDWASLSMPLAGSYLALLFFLVISSGVVTSSLKRWAAALCYFAVFVSLVAFKDVRESDIAQGALMFLAVGVWYFVYLVIFAKPITERRLVSFKFSALCAPNFWLPISTPVPGMLPNWLAKARGSSFNEIQNSGLRLLVFVVIPVYIALEILKSIAPIHPLLYSISRSYIQFRPVPLGIVEAHLTWAELWISAILGVVYVTANFALQFGIGVTVARMCGVPLLRGVYKVHRATSFHEFFYRFNYYYAQFALDLFVVPLMKLLKRWKLPANSLRPIGFAVGVTLATIAFHSLRWPHLLSTRPVDFFWREIQIGFYYASIGALVGLSIWISAKIKTAAWKRVELILFFCFFSALALAYRNYTVSYREQAYLMLRRLFLLD